MGISSRTPLAVVAVALAALSLTAGPLASAGAATHDRGGARAQAACPVCAAVAITAIRAAALRAAPVAIRAASRIRGGPRVSRARVRAGAIRARRWVGRVRHASITRTLLLFVRLPKYVKGCARGFVDHIRDYGDISLLRAFYACGRGIVEIHLGKDPLGPIDR